MIADLIAWLIILAIALMPIALLIIWIAGIVYVARAIIASLCARSSRPCANERIILSALRSVRSSRPVACLR